MRKTTKEDKKIIDENLKQLHLDINSFQDIFTIENKISYMPMKDYENNNYRVYEFINLEDIEIYLTPTTRLENVDKKYKLAKPLSEYLNTETEEQIELYNEFLQLVKKIDINHIKQIELEQKQYNKKIPFEIKYKDNFMWDIYYSEKEKKYFIMFPTKESQVDTLFYIIKKQIEIKSKKNQELIYVPINNKTFNYGFLKRSEIADLENYLWYFTGNWPLIYELEDKQKNKTIAIIGKTQVYEKVKSLYKIVFLNKEEAQEEFKLIKALFILKSNMEKEYDFKTALDETGKINFYYNHTQITYELLSDFIKNEIKKKKERLDIITKQSIFETEKWVLLKQTIQKQNIEYLSKEKQILTFLECKKTFFGRVSYFFKKKKKKNQNDIINNIKEENKSEINEQKVQLEEKDFYTIEDLLKIGKVLEETEKKYKDMQMDIKALENKKENLENKIKNATLYINEIESHKKSIFDFWKFTNKDNINLLNEGPNEQQEKNKKIKKIFSYEDDIEEFAIKVDDMQRKTFNQKECDAAFAIYQDVNSFNIVSKEKILKKDEKQIEKSLKEKQIQYENNYEQIKEKDFDIFGSVIEDKTKIKILKNHKHREIEKSFYKVLDIHLNTTIEQYEDTIKHYEKILEESYNKMTSPYDISIYNISEKNIENEKWVIMNMNPKLAITESEIEKETIILNRINIKEGMEVIFYSNIMFYDNLNQTLPSGMDITQKVLLNLEKYELKLISRKDFKMNFLKNEYDSEIKKIQVYEYDILRKD